MPTSRYAYSLSKRQEQFSVAYVQSICSVAGYKVIDVKTMDEDSVDIIIRQKGSNEGRPYFDTLTIQAKCTYAKKPSKDGYLHFPLSAKNYDDLRAATGTPFILVVLCIPSEDEMLWLIERPDSMTLYNIAYWMSLRGKPELPPTVTGYENRTTTILIPTSQRLDVNGLTAIMDILADGGFPR